MTTSSFVQFQTIDAHYCFCDNGDISTEIVPYRVVTAKSDQFSKMAKIIDYCRKHLKR